MHAWVNGIMQMNTIIASGVIYNVMHIYIAAGQACMQETPACISATEASNLYSYIMEVEITLHVLACALQQGELVRPDSIISSCCNSANCLLCALYIYCPKFLSRYACIIILWQITTLNIYIFMPCMHAKSSTMQFCTDR